ncbi:putative pseudouridine-5'-monophosphatase OS=Drosophila melanogaster GN=Gs1l PE=2 SV=2 [Rhizoctonia solani AG-1 IB]|uniref:Putative pseudouridine-5'-monophosphatase n=1 Tax=Thanatephorus cucumeris (strain AG1-IB / isolate 7/3/14) TaxID=1108050 RepID=A0A0B7FV20_THACB|nr:putative pseudouridine-5'-monophosphatase OS=Drosophila melanogaster GN=Gs1l PE=2 SV=2 [Rhizoctonia solani AG-1 IB]
MSYNTKPQIKYVLFDMDGLLIDSEQVYTNVTNDILAPYGKVMTWDIKKELMGKPERAAAEKLMSYFPDISLTTDEYIVRRRAAQDLAWPTVQLLPGAHKLISHLAAHKIPIGVATGSQRRNYELKTGHLQGTFGLFGSAVVCGDDAAVQHGKPAPDVFLYAAKQTGFPEVGLGEGAVSGVEKATRAQGLVFEDATSGVIAGKRAGMNVVWIPDPNLAALTTADELGADETLGSLEEFVPESWGLPPYPKN